MRSAFEGGRADNPPNSARRPTRRPSNAHAFEALQALTGLQVPDPCDAVVTGLAARTAPERQCELCAALSTSVLATNSTPLINPNTYPTP